MMYRKEGKKKPLKKGLSYQLIYAASIILSTGKLPDPREFQGSFRFLVGGQLENRPQLVNNIIPASSIKTHFASLVLKPIDTLLFGGFQKQI